jgi:hypothetical protein
MTRVFNWLYSRDVAAAALFISLTTLLAAGLHNVANGFADVKMSSSPIIHWASAVAIELGVVAIGLTIAVRARSGNQNFRLYAGILLFVAASVFANYDASLESLTGGQITWRAVQSLDRWTLTKAALLGGAIPIMVLFVIESLRELAAEGFETRQAQPHAPSVTVPLGEGNAASERTPVSASRNGYMAEDRGTPAQMRQIIIDEPTIPAAELARRLKVGRATIYRWRDDLGVSRKQGTWVVS